MKPITTLPYIGERGARLWKTEACHKLMACICAEPGREYPVVCEHYVPYDSHGGKEGCRAKENEK